MSELDAIPDFYLGGERGIEEICTGTSYHVFCTPHIVPNTPSGNVGNIWVGLGKRSCFWNLGVTIPIIKWSRRITSPNLGLNDTITAFNLVCGIYRTWRSSRAMGNPSCIHCLGNLAAGRWQSPFRFRHTAKKYLTTRTVIQRRVLTRNGGKQTTFQPTPDVVRAVNCSWIVLRLEMAKT